MRQPVRCTAPRCGIVLPELTQIGPAQAIAPVFLIGPTVQVGYAVEVTIKRRLGLPLEGGFFYGIVKSDAVQQGPQMRRMKKEKPKVGGRRLPPEALTIASTFRAEYPQKELELLWGALLNVYGTTDRAIEAVRANPQILNPSYSFCNTILESKKVLRSVMDEEEALEVMRLSTHTLEPESETGGCAASLTHKSTARALCGALDRPRRAAVRAVARGAWSQRDQKCVTEPAARTTLRSTPGS